MRVAHEEEVKAHQESGSEHTQKCRYYLLILGLPHSHCSMSTPSLAELLIVLQLTGRYAGRDRMQSFQKVSFTHHHYKCVIVEWRAEQGKPEALGSEHIDPYGKDTEETSKRKHKEARQTRNEQEQKTTRPRRREREKAWKGQSSPGEVNQS